MATSNQLMQHLPAANIIPVQILTIIPGHNTSQQLCGVPGFCQALASSSCLNVSLNKCQDCSQVASGFFVFLIACLGLAILIGNSLIISVSIYRYHKRTAAKMDAYKASLAVGDLLTGFQIFAVAIPNFGWAIMSTLNEIRSKQDLLRNSPQAIAGSFFHLLGYVGSLYHLLLLGILRLYAIKWPINYRCLTKKTSVMLLAVVWTLSILTSTIPAWFPRTFTFEFYHTTFLYFPSQVALNSINSQAGPAIAMLTILLLLPFVLMTLAMILTALFVRQQLQQSRQRLGDEIARHNDYAKKEFSAFKTIAVMQAGFTLTLVPLGVVLGLFYAGYLDCNNVSRPYTSCFYLAMTNSLVNVVIYSAWDKNFRSSVAEMYTKLIYRKKDATSHQILPDKKCKETSV